MGWYKQTLNQLYETLDSSSEGLSNQEAINRLIKFGPNTFDVKSSSIWQTIIEPFKSIFMAVLLLASIVSLMSGEVVDAIVVLAVIMINAIIFYIQHYMTTRVLRNLKKKSAQKVTVIRDSTHTKIDASMLVPGDIFYINEGDKVAADARLVTADNLQVDESSLTGESIHVRKNIYPLTADKPLYERHNMVFQGSFVSNGRAAALVVDTGARTEFGKIASLATSKQSKSPVQQKIDDLIAIMIKAISVVIVLVFLLSLARGIPAGEALRFVLSMAVSAVPEGLPVALTVIVVMGMRRMAKHSVLVRSFKAIEDIGLITLIATDKTGTLTKNNLSLVDEWSVGDEDPLSVASMTADSNQESLDPLDIAIFNKMDKKIKSEVTRLYPFNLDSRMSGAYFEKKGMIYIKGSPEHMLNKADISPKLYSMAESSMRKLTAEGYRVIGVGRHKVHSRPPKDLNKLSDKSIEFIGFLAFADELRGEAKSAIKKAFNAGIDVRMITGDHYETAYNIGNKLGIAKNISQTISGGDLPKDQHDLAVAISDKKVFCRILPEDKYRILKALKTTNITAMTGDGVNDVPALANAHVGIAMGSGSDIAKDAGGMVLLNDNFASIIDAISEGRRIFDNIRRMMFYLLSTSLGEVMAMVGALLFGLPLPVTAIQILWINIVTDTVMVLPLGMEPAEDGHMSKPPRKPSDPILNRSLISRLVFVALAMAVSVLAIVMFLSNSGYSLAYIQTVAMTSLVVAQWVNAFNARSELASSFTRIGRPNFSLLVGLALAILLQALILFGPLASTFGMVEVSMPILLTSMLFSAVLTLTASELHKLYSRKSLQ